MAAALVSLLLAACWIRAAQAAADCEFPVRRSRVSSTWQSSFDDGSTCFYNRSQSDEESVLNNTKISYRFFHSAAESQADNGFHWFAVRLNESVLIRSVTVKGREDGARHVYNRSVGIEIWTSASSSEIFSGDHCSSNSMSREFRESRQHLRLCGVTEMKGSNISNGENFTVSCIAEVRQLLLRKNNSSTGSWDSLFMSFTDLRLQTVQLKSSAPQLVSQSSSFTVSCSLHCNESELSSNSTNQLQLCFPNGSCSTVREMRVARAQPLHSGSYTCLLGSVRKTTAVTVLYPPSSVSVSELSNGSCSCLPSVIVMFRSSFSVPPSEHRCSADAAGDGEKSLTLISQDSDSNGSLSRWSVSRDEFEGREVAITCTAVQALPTGISFNSVSSATVHLSCSGPTPSRVSLLSDVRVRFAAGFGLGFITAAAILGVFCRFAGTRCSRSPPRSHCDCGNSGHFQLPNRETEQRRTDGLRSALAVDGRAATAGGNTGSPDAAATEYENSEYKLETATGVYVE